MNDLSLQFNQPAFDLEFFLKITGTVEEIADEMVSELQGGDDAIEYRKELVEFGDMIIKYNIGSDNWNAFINQFGKGSQMSSRNPFLGAYQSSGYWNKNRQSNAIYTRTGKATYIIPDWETGHGEVEYTVNRSGGDKFNLEKLGGDYAPKAGSEHILRVFNRYQKIMEQRLQEMFSSIHLSQFVQGGAR